MPRFFVAKEQIFDSEILIHGLDAKHIKSSLRMREGDAVCICDGEKHDYDCELSYLSDSLVKAKILSESESLTEPDLYIRLFQSMPKGDKLDFIVQKAVETGVSEIIPVISSRCVSKPDIRSAFKKAERLQKIACEAAMQSERGIIPVVGEMLSFKAAVVSAGSDSASCICYERERVTTVKEFIKNIRKIKSPYKTVSFFIGPEGGYDEDEAEFASARGIVPVSLGHRILRCETAPIFVLSCIAYETDI